MTHRLAGPRQDVAGIVEGMQVVAGCRTAGAARFPGQQAETAEIGGDGPAGFGLPPVIDHRFSQQLPDPLRGRRIAALAGQIEGLQARQVVGGHQGAGRILLLDGAQRGGGGEQGMGAVLGADPPQRAGIRRADRLALVENRGQPGQQRRVDDVAVPHHPAHVRGGEHHLPGGQAVDHGHGFVQRHRVAAIVAHHAFGAAGGPGGVQDVERVGGRDRHRRVWRRGVHRFCKIMVPVRQQRRPEHGPLQDKAGSGLVRSHRECRVEQRLVGNHPAGLQPARGGDDDFWARVVNPFGQLGGGEAAEHHGMDGAEPGAGQHGHHRLRHHRHVDHHPVAALDAEASQRAGQTGRAVAQLGISETLLPAGERRIPDQRGPLAGASGHVAVQAIVAGVEQPTAEPAPVGARIRIEHPIPLTGPVDRFGGSGPPGFWVARPGGVFLLVSAGRRLLHARTSRGRT